jgi:hypothetical protein
MIKQSYRTIQALETAAQPLPNVPLTMDPHGREEKAN